jgi:hypothetical protein
VLFWLTRGFCLSTLATRIPYGLFSDGVATPVQPWEHLSLFRRMLPYYINHYRVFGLNLSPHAYGIVEVTIQALLVVLALVKSLVQRLNDGLKIGLHLTMNTGSTANDWAFVWSSSNVELALKIAR